MSAVSALEAARRIVEIVDGGASHWTEQSDVARVARAYIKACEALEPFAKLAALRELDCMVADDHMPLYLSLRNGNVQQAVIREGLTVGDIRRAALSCSAPQVSSGGRKEY